MKKMLIALTALTAMGMGVAMANTTSYRRGYSDAVEGNGNTCNSNGYNSQNEYDCNRGFVEGTRDMNNASGGN